MAAPSSAGFRVSVIPQLAQVDPRLFNTGAPLADGLNSGIGAYRRLQDISAEKAMAPVRQQLAQIQVDEAANRALLAPIDRDIQLAQLDEIRQNAAMPRIIQGDVTYEDQTRVFPAALDE